MASGNGRRFIDDIARQLMFEAEARRTGMTIEHRRESEGLVYRFAIDVPIHDEKRLVTTRFGEGSNSRALVFIDGSPCLRHRYIDGSLCMWFGPDAESERWVIADGLLALIGHIELHAFCEADCRTGLAWPKEEAPGEHPRPRSCPTCQGQGS